MKTKTCIFAGANFITTCTTLSMHLVLGHISLPSQSLLEARDVTNILITQVPHFLNLYCKIQTLTFSTHIYDLHPRAEKKSVHIYMYSMVYSKRYLGATTHTCHRWVQILQVLLQHSTWSLP